LIVNGHPQLLPSIAALTDPASLARVIGRVDRVRVEPLQGVGYSNATLSRVEIDGGDANRWSFVLKHTRLNRDWTACRTDDDRGREALLLMEAALAPTWEIVACPYVALAIEPGEIGLLLHDLTPDLLPNRREPLSEPQERALLGALTQLHARFWRTRVDAIDWLVRPRHYCDLLAPQVAADPTVLALLPPPLQADVSRGWASALSRLPAVVVQHLTRPGLEWERQWVDLPRTLLHGDVKVANFALPAGGRVAAFDWAMAGAGPCTIDLGWYLAVNASRLTGPKEQIFARYRSLLEIALGEPLQDSLWKRLTNVAIVCGARMLLWSKALGLDVARPGAREEWTWWVNRLTDPALS
jgi:hypothetical protein